MSTVCWLEATYIGLKTLEQNEKTSTHEQTRTKSSPTIIAAILAQADKQTKGALVKNTHNTGLLVSVRRTRPAAQFGERVPRIVNMALDCGIIMERIEPAEEPVLGSQLVGSDAAQFGERVPRTVNIALDCGTITEQGGNIIPPPRS